MSLVGTYSADITPVPPVDLNGYILRFGRAEGIHDRLYAHILYVEHNGQKALLISLDILTISTDLAEHLRDQLSGTLGIPREAILMAAIHTHSAVGGPYLRNVGKESQRWRKEFEEKILAGSHIAKETAKEAEFYAYQTFAAVGINRRKETRGTDPHTPFVVVKSGDEMVAILINYNCHAVCLTEDNLQISADYVHYLREYLYGKFAQKFAVLFFNGGSGDIDPKKRGSFEAARYTGEKLGEEIFLAFQAYTGEKFEPDLRFLSQTLEIPYGWQPSLSEAEANLQEHIQLLKNAQSKEEEKIARAFYIWAEDILELVKNGRLPKSLKVQMSFLRLGKVSFLALPLEIFSSISLRLRKTFGDTLLFVVSYANGYSGYLADKVAYQEGGYEVEQWHKYAGILPQIPGAEDIFWEKVEEIKKKIDS